MTTTSDPNIEAWRSHLAAKGGLDRHDIDELEAHLCDQIDALEAVGLDPDEAFLIGVRRLGNTDALSSEYARQETGRLWRQLSVGDNDDGGSDGGNASSDDDTMMSRSSAVVALFYAAAAGLIIVIALLASISDWLWLVENFPWLLAPVVGAWLTHRRGASPRAMLWPMVAAAGAAMVLNLYPFTFDSQSHQLAVVHIPIVLAATLIFPFASAELGWRERVMDFVRFVGEGCIYYLLIAMGGSVFLALTTAILVFVAEPIVTFLFWCWPGFFAGLVIVAGWLVEEKKRVVENMAPVLSMIFTPLFAIMIAVAVLAYADGGLHQTFDRSLLILFDVLLVVVLGLVLYATSARPPLRPVGWQDRTQIVLVAGSLVLDGFVLVSMLMRIGDLGWTPNRVAAIGLNIVLFVDLVGVLYWSVRFVTGRSAFLRIERWHTLYLPVFTVWAACVGVVLPVMFSFN